MELLGMISPLAMWPAIAVVPRFGHDVLHLVVHHQRSSVDDHEALVVAFVRS